MLYSIRPLEIETTFHYGPLDSLKRSMQIRPAWNSVLPLLPEY